MSALLSLRPYTRQKQCVHEYGASRKCSSSFGPLVAPNGHKRSINLDQSIGRSIHVDLNGMGVGDKRAGVLPFQESIRAAEKGLRQGTQHAPGKSACKPRTQSASLFRSDTSFDQRLLETRDRP